MQRPPSFSFPVSLLEWRPPLAQRISTRSGRRSGWKAQNHSPRISSLYDELFPNEQGSSLAAIAISEPADLRIPRLPLPDVRHLNSHESNSGNTSRLSEQAQAASNEAFRRWNPAVLAFNRASKSLVDNDFRRLAPRGRYIEEWTGPGDILKGLHLFYKLTPAARC